jgi:hypothetical protein
MSRRLPRVAILILALSAGLALVNRVRADELDRFRAQSELQAQKVRGEVKAGLAQARTLERSDPVRARDLLRTLQGRLEDDVSLPERERTRLLQQVRDRLQAVIPAARAREAAEEEAAQKKVSGVKQKPRDPGKGPTSVADDIYKTAKDRFDQAQKLKKKKELGFSDALNEINVSASQLTEQRITDRFIRATEMRKQKLTAKEKTLLKALNSVMTVDFDKTPFKDVIDYIQEKTKQAIIIDEGSIKEAMLDSEDPVTFKSKVKITVRTILKKVLADRGLTYIIREGTIQVVTPQKARESMVVRTYPVADLVTPVGTPFNPFMNEFMTLSNVQSLIAVIQSAVDPAIWEQGATITYLPTTRSLVIRAPAEIHYSLGFGATR